ncbi:MAG TPA: mandelate racemase/muconate lactonizing enzyme family protein [Dehalococcoidales bacterium]|nr:mandelate racemase/muconate lactonizing enzyme family protein [Dehalococcoidales bacterium]
MKITKIECIPTSSPIAKVQVLSGSVISTINSVVVKMHTDEGITGIAESGDANVWYMGESMDSIMHLINEVFGPKILLGEDPFNVEKIVAKMDYAVKYNNQAKAVIDFALHDIMGKKLGVPVYKLLGGLSNEKIELGFVIGAGTPEELIEEAQKALKAGFHSIKLKVGALPEEKDIANVQALREALGSDVKIMIDANAGWHYYQAMEILKKLEPYRLAYCEQPLPWWDVNGLAALRGQVRIPIFADESAAELKQVMECIEKRAVDGFLIKIPKAGGYLKAQKWVTLAKVAGLPVLCGCLKGSGIEAATQAHFIAATEWMSKHEHENAGVLENHDIFDTVTTKVTNDLAKELPRYENGFMYAPDKPGIGVELNEEVMKKYITPGKKPTVISV